MEVYVKESLHVLDYKNKIVDSIFLSDDHTTPGYAYDITITEANTGYSDLKFNMPNMVIDDEGNQVHNPKLKLLTPLVKLRYHRQVYYTGDKPITVREPQGYGDTVTYVDKTYSNKYPENIIEDYVMDYIVQPIDKKRDVLKLTTSFTAMDYPRFTLSKKKVGLTIAQGTKTKKDWSLYKDKPMDIIGTIKYVEWTDKLSNSIGLTDIPIEWDPLNAIDYPLTKDDIIELMDNTAEWPYGLLATAFYWPITSTARFEGKMYTEGGFLVLHLYDFYSLTSAGIDPERHVGPYAFEWTQLAKMDTLLCPNKADNYLHHILEGTNWSVKKLLDEQGNIQYDAEGNIIYDVDIVTESIPKPNIEDFDALSDKYEDAAMTCNISISNGNCYNAITTLCRSLQLYPIFDCENREVSLKTFAGKNYGLTYNLGSNLKTSTTKGDGEKVITKLYVTGGKDYTGSANITIGTATRSYIEPSDNPDTRNPWDPNAPEYIIKRSPYGVNYILNFKWMYDNGWMTKEQILGLYSINEEINTLNKGFITKYTEDRLQTLQEYSDAVNNYDLKQGEYQAILNSMMNKYYKEYGKQSEGMIYAFHKAPLGTHKNGAKNYLWIKHCYGCGKTISVEGSAKPAATCECGSTDVQVDELYIPVYNDYRDSIDPPPFPDYPYATEAGLYRDVAYEPYVKGDYLKLLTTLDKYVDGDPDDAEVDGYDIGYYEGQVYLTRLIPLSDKNNSIDGYDYKINNIYTRASSGHIEEWNANIDGTKVTSFVYNYGKMLDYLRIVEDCLDKIEKLEERYNAWEAESDRLHKLIQDAYGDYIVEGNYTNSEQPYVGLLFREGMEASDKFAVPEITYTLDVIDSSGLIEYRQPQATIYSCGDCNYSSYTPINECPRCGGTTLIATYDTYNDLIHLLHSVGQIVPKAGDYVRIYDEPMGMYGIPGLITEISRRLDNPIDNKIKLDTSYTDDEELVGNIITATNTVLNNSDIYARTAVLKADGTIDSSSITKTLNSPNASLSIVGTNGNMLLTGSALQFTDPNDNTRAIKYSGTGVFTTTTLSENEEGTEWQKLITPTGINAAYINAGQIDTKNISIMSGTTSKILIDQYGLVIKNRGNKSAHVTSFDTDKAKKDAEYARKWGEDNNIAGFMGVDLNNNAIVYTKGFLVANEGSNIANWITSNEGFYHLNSSNQKDLWLSPGGISGTVGNSGSQKFAIYANKKFGVTTDGVLYAQGANIQGTITSNNVTITGGSLKIGSNFEVSNTGVLKATGADIGGTITTDNLTATGGSISNLTASNINATNLNATGGTFTNISVTGTSTFSGSIDASSITSGTFASARIPNLSASKITSGTMSANRISGGTLNITTSGGYLKAGLDTTHPEVSGLNITGDAGVAFNGNSISGLGTINMSGGGTGQTATVAIAYNFTWTTRASVLTGVSYKTAELSFKNGIFIGIGNIQDKEVAIG